METYGSTIRQIRIKKGFSHKEIYTGILSKSYAIDFEKGLYDIKFNLMLKILERLMISVDELLLIHSQYTIIPCYEPLLNINLERIKSDPSYSSKIEKQLYEKMKITKTSSTRLQYEEIVALRCAYSDPDFQNLPEYQAAKNYIQKYLFDVETWTLSEFRIFSDMSFIFENGDIKTTLFLTAWNTLEKYRAHPDYQVYLSHLLVNNVYQLICSKQYLVAKKAIDKLQELTIDPNMMAWKVPMLYYDGLLTYATGDSQTGLSKINKAKQIYHLCGDNFMVEQIETGLKYLQTQDL